MQLGVSEEAYFPGLNLQDYDKINTAINEHPLLQKGFFLSSYLFQPYIFQVTKALPENQGSHTHPAFEMSLTLEGEITYTIGRHSTRVEAKVGDVVIIPPQEKHYWQLQSDNVTTASFFCYISSNGIKPYRQMNNLKSAIAAAHFHIKQFIQYEQCIHAMLNLLSQRVALQAEELRILQKMAFVYLVRTLLPNLLEEELALVHHGNRSTPDSLVEQIKRYIYNHSFRIIKLDELQRHLGFNKDHLNRIFKQHEHLSIKQFIIKDKVKRASKMLITSGYDIKTIALENGFTDPNYFCATFKKHTGKTPVQFRQENRGL